MESEQNHQQAAIICPHCSLPLYLVIPRPHHRLQCPRCAQTLYKYRRNSLEKTLAFSLTGLLLFIPAVSLPLLTLGVFGLSSTSSLAETVASLFAQQDYLIGTVVLCTAIIAPFTILIMLFLVSLGIIRNWPATPLTTLFRWYHHVNEWAMTDVFLIGIFITIIKMAHSSDIEFNTGFFCFIGLVLMTLAAQSTTAPYLFWQLLEKNSGSTNTQWPLKEHETTPPILCHCCHKIIPATAATHSHCPRCRASLHPRKQNSVARTWALLITAIILTIPANLLPIMQVEFFGMPDRSTILDGIIYFFHEGSYGIGFIIFTASILVPLFKIAGLIIVLLSIQLRWKSWLRHKTTMMRFIQFIGRWSMLDIFVISLLCALVQFGFLSTIEIAPAAVYFTGVVICTMMAATTFDIRLIWDTTGSPS
ncbi:paraquat-inducible protein A [Desulfogranum japonicum]|uniref:paraquat-inducible protein A n=1 Tax=Desulfogranum japonicum TaxID=231447 RepID=UPI00040B6EDC|nr:paraquat-inducible protein A [Desulfogranum japonicum]